MVVKALLIGCIMNRNEDQGEWTLYSCYGIPYNSENVHLWNQLKSTIANGTHPWVLIGDLNKINKEFEKQ